MDTVATGIIVATGTLCTGGLGALAAWVVAKSQDRTSKANVQSAITEGFSGLMAGYEARIAGLCTQVSSLEDLVRGLSAHVMDLEDALAKRGMPIPPRSYPLAVIAGGRHDDP